MDYQFKKLPVFLFKDFRNLSSDAKLLYTVMLDRKNLSEKNGWTDENGTYIVFTVNEVDNYIPSSKAKASKLMKELRDCGLITRKRMGQGKADRIYVLDYEPQVGSASNDDNGLSTAPVPEDTNNEHKSSGYETLKLTVSAPSNTDSKYNNIRDYLSVIYSDNTCSDRTDRIPSPAEKDISECIIENSGLNDFPDDPINAMLADIIREIMDGTGDGSVRINGMDKPKAIVRSCFRKLDRKAIDRFYYQLVNHTDLKEIRYKRAYMRSMLYNSCFESVFPEEDLKYGT